MNIEEMKELLEFHRTKARVLDKKIEEIEDRPRAKALTGKFFAYRNSYSCPKKPSDYWNLYVRVVRVRGTFVDVEEFQKDCDGRVTFETNRLKPFSSFYGGSYKQITERRYWSERKKLIAALGQEVGR